MKQTVLTTAGLMTAAAAFAAPAQADPMDDAFLDSLTNAGIATALNPTDTVALGQSVCPMLVEPGKSFASVASQVGLTQGLSPEAASLFAGIAISAYCPSMIANITDGSVLDSIDGLDSLSGLNIPGF